MTLAKNGYFLRAFELKSKFPHVALKNPPPPPQKKKMLDNYLVVQTKNKMIFR